MLEHRGQPIEGCAGHRQQDSRDEATTDVVVEYRQPLGHERRHAHSIPRLARWGHIYEEGKTSSFGAMQDGRQSDDDHAGLPPLCYEIRSSL